MTQEHTITVRLPSADIPKLQLLRRQAQLTAERLASADEGDRTELLRYEQLMAEIESMGYRALAHGGASDGSTGETVTIAWPFAAGASAFTALDEPLAPPAKTWKAENRHASRTEASYERFVAQLKSWTRPRSDGDPEPGPLCPSEMQNRALTEALRRFAQGSTPIAASVAYRDGSTAPPFPLRSVPMSTDEPDDGREVLRMTLLSIRHLEMDVDVDGAWLRNREISLPRPAGRTDELVYKQTLEQLETITRDGPVTLHLYQTGLPPANVGFYRALIDHHHRPRRQPVAVVPFYYAGDDGYARSELPWVVTS